MHETASMQEPGPRLDCAPSTRRDASLNLYVSSPRRLRAHVTSASVTLDFAGRVEKELGVTN